MLAALPGLGRLRVDNAPERFFVRDRASLEREAAFERLFGAERRVWIVLEGADLWTAGGLETVAAIERAAADSPAVERASGLWSRNRWLLARWPPEDVARFRERALADTLTRSAGWVSPSGGLATVLVEFAPTASATDLDELERRVRSVDAGGLQLSLTGLPVFERAIDASMRRLVLRLLPMLLVLAVVLLRLGLGSWRAAAPPLAFVTVVLTVVLGAIGATVQTVDMISIVLVPILFVIALATAIHLQMEFDRERRAGLDATAATAATMRRSGRAVVWTAVTTAIAFASFGLSEVPPVRSLGLWLAAGLGWMLLVVFGFYRSLLEARSAPIGEAVGAVVPSSSGQAGAGSGRDGKRWAALALGLERRRAPVLALFAGLALVAAAGAARLQIDSGLLTYFAPDHPARRAIAALEDEGLAGAVAELLLRLPADADWTVRFRDPAGLERLAALGAELRRLEVGGLGVRGVLGAGDLYRAALDDVVVDGGASESVRWMVLGMLQGDADTAARLDSVLGDDGRAARLTVLLPLRGPAQLDPLLAAVREAAERSFPEAAVSIEGELPLLLASQRHLTRTLIESFALTLASIALILVVITRSLAGAARALIPNLWPVLLVFGVMGWTGTPLDSTTVMIAAVVLGLAVDDTLHTLVHLRSGGNGNPASRVGANRLATALARVGPAHALTSVVLVAGFAVCALSDFLPIGRFGALAAVGVAAALAGDLLLFPALLAKTD